MTLFHGTDSESAYNIITHGIDIACGDESVDNAPGFYMTPNFNFAVDRAHAVVNFKKRFQNAGVTPCVVIINAEFPADDSLSVKTFPDCSYEWKEFVFYNRVGTKCLTKWNISSANHNLDFKYDVVDDWTADTQITQIVSRLRYKPTISDIAEVISNIGISNKPNWDKQISVHSKVALKYIHIVRIQEV